MDIRTRSHPYLKAPAINGGMHNPARMSTGTAITQGHCKLAHCNAPLFSQVSEPRDRDCKLGQRNTQLHLEILCTWSRHGTKQAAAPLTHKATGSVSMPRGKLLNDIGTHRAAVACIEANFTH
eukprot:scaffold76319_cov14-Tisochrysis_lutea.AAC.1